MLTIPEHFAEANSLREKILYVLSVMQKGSAGEIAMEIVELQGIASEEGVADITIEIEKELDALHEQGLVAMVKEHRQKKRYSLANASGVDA